MTIYGWDMSHFDAPSIGTAVADGIAFITHKAGGDAVDAELDDWWDSVRNLPADRVLLGAYWVLYPGRPVERAEAFVARLDAVCAGWRDRPFMLQVDCEKWGGNAATVPSKSEIRAFCDRLVDRMPKLRPIVYAPKWVYGDSLAGLGYPLWASSYVTGAGAFRGLYPGDGSSRWGTYSGQVPAILQYSSSATIGGQTTCDSNAFRGTFEELTALVAPGWSDDMPTVDEICDEMERRLNLSALTGGRTVGGTINALADTTGVDNPVAKAVWMRPLGDPLKPTNPDGTPQTTTAGAWQRYSAANLNDAVTRIAAAVTSGDAADATRDAALAANLAALPGAVRAELEADGGADPVAVEAAVGRALARLQIVVSNPAS